MPNYFMHGTHISHVFYNLSCKANYRKFHFYCGEMTVPNLSYDVLSLVAWRLDEENICSLALVNILFSSHIREFRNEPKYWHNKLLIAIANRSDSDISIDELKVVGNALQFWKARYLHYTSTIENGEVFFSEDPCDIEMAFLVAWGTPSPYMTELENSCHIRAMYCEALYYVIEHGFFDSFVALIDGWRDEWTSDSVTEDIINHNRVDMLAYITKKYTIRIDFGSVVFHCLKNNRMEMLGMICHILPEEIMDDFLACLRYAERGRQLGKPYYSSFFFYVL